MIWIGTTYQCYTEMCDPATERAEPVSRPSLILLHHLNVPTYPASPPSNEMMHLHLHIAISVPAGYHWTGYMCLMF